MESKINLYPQSAITARLVINGSPVTMNFPVGENSLILDQAKEILTSAFDRTADIGNLHLDNRSLMQP